MQGLLRTVALLVLGLLLIAWVASIVLPLAAIHAALTGYWGPEWPDAGTCAVAWSIEWELTGAVLIGAVYLIVRGRVGGTEV